MENTIEIYKYGMKLGEFSVADWSDVHYVDYVDLDARAEFEECHGKAITDKLFRLAIEALK